MGRGGVFIATEMVVRVFLAIDMIKEVFFEPQKEVERGVLSNHRDVEKRCYIEPQRW